MNRESCSSHKEIHITDNLKTQPRSKIMVGVGQQQQSTDTVEQQQQQQVLLNNNTGQQQIGSVQDSTINTTQIQQPMQIPMQQQTSDIISPLSTDPQIAQYNPLPTTNTQQHTPVGVLQQVAQQPLFQQQQQPTDAASNTNNSPPKAAVKKGRFRVVKGTNEGKVDDQSVPNSTANSTVKKGRFVVSKKPSTNNVTGEPTTKDGKICLQESDVSSTKPMKKIDNVKDATEKATNDQSKPNSPAVKKNSGKKSPIPQKKGRFLVTTAASSAANLQAVEAAAKLAASIGQDKDVNGDSSSVDQSVTKGDASRRGSLADNQVAEVATKKKGRFVVKTGGNLTNSPGTNCTPPEAGVQQNRIGTQTVQQQPLPANIQMPAYFGNVNNNMPISGIVPTTSLVQDVNGQIMVVSNVFPICEQNIQQHNSTQQQQQQQQSQIHQVYAPPVQNAITRVQSAISSIGSQAPQPLQPLPNFTDAPARPQQVSTEDNPPPASKAHVPRASRPAGSSGSNWSSLKGKNGRLIGGGGVGKVLHHLDTMRTEIVEADRTITSLQSDNRILRDKNKELEAKNKELLRILADEKRHRHTAEVNYQTLCQQVSSKHYERINSEQESTKSSVVDASVQDTTDKEVVLETPISSFEDNLQQKPDTSTTQKDNTNAQDKASTLQKSPRPKPPMSSSTTKSPKPIRPNVTIPRTSSFDSPKPTNKKVVRGLSPASAASQSMSCLPSANQFDPLARGIPGPDIITDNTCNVTPVIITTEELKLDESKQRHFDPLGTPERRVSASTVILNNEIPQIPIPMGGSNVNSTVPAVIPIIQRQQNSKEEEDDPFDEIVSSRKRSTFSGT